jgi:tRNA A-37 threonylcarbamoyl transferase component Bud32
MPVCSTCGTRYGSTVRICIKDGTPLVVGRIDDPHIGKLLDGKYRIDAFISGGGMGSVYRATHVMLNKPVAVKVIRPELVTSDDVVRRFQREARAASTLDHPNIVTVYDLGQAEDGTLYIAMEFIDGASLKEAIRRDGPVPPERATEIMRQVAGALSVAHQKQIIHRDLKSQNLMLTGNPLGGTVVKLVDFGIAKTFDEPALQMTEAGFVLGTPHYMSPEQAAGKAVDHRADVYSLGVILYEMLIGEVPFGDASTTSVLIKVMTEAPQPPSRRRADVAIPPALEAAAMRCLEKDPGKRFQSATEFAQALDGMRPDQPTLVRVPALAPPIATRPGRSWMTAGLLLAAIPIVGALAFGMVVPSLPHEERPRRTADVALAPEMEPLPAPRQASPAPPRLPPPQPSVRASAQAPELPIPQPAVEPAVVRPERPPVYVGCDGPLPVCSAVRNEIVTALRRSNMPVVTTPGNAEVELAATVGILGETASLDFGTPIVTTTYSVALLGASHGIDIPMPPDRAFSFDARFGAARLQEHARLIAAGAIDAVQVFWSR